MEATELIGGALGGALVTSVLGPLVTQGKERRSVRADVLRALAKVETARWADAEQPPSVFREAVVEFRAAALVAALPRDLVDHYLDVAGVARSTSDSAFEIDPDPQYGGGISLALSELVRETGETVVAHVWRPHRRRFLLGHDLRVLDARRAKVRSELEGQRINWDAGQRWL